jgi:choice-of-anchor B domain-containing protein
MMKLPFLTAVTLAALGLMPSFAIVVSVTATTKIDEYEIYGCSENNNATNSNPTEFETRNPNACFCGLLNDVLEVTEVERSAATEVPCIYGNADGYPCHNVDLLSFIPLSAFGSVEANDIWGWADTESGREFALLSLGDGQAFIEITDPANPVYLGKLLTKTVSSSWRDVKVYKNHAFIVSEAELHGMQVFDLTQLLSVASTTPVMFTETAYYNDGGVLGNAHNIAIDEDTGTAFVMGGTNGCSGGLHMVDISTPSNPTKAGCYGGDGYTHDAHCVVYDGPDTTYVGKEICFASNEDTVTIVDVTSKTSPVQVSRTGYAQDGYTHQGWLSEDHKYFVFGDETDETGFGFNTKTLVMDVQNLDSPFLAGSYFSPTKAIDHNLYIKDNVMFLANYRAGVRVLTIDDFSTASFTEIGFFDIYPSSDSANYNGAWSVYPFFNSGSVIVSGIEEGLFVLRPDLTVTSSPTVTPLPPVCNGDGSCDVGENCNNCPSDCGSQTSGNPNNRYCCYGDVLPNCGDDRCGCGDVVDPPTDPPSDCGGNKASYSSSSDCCNGNCKNGGCKGGGRRLGHQQTFGEAVAGL